MYRFTRQELDHLREKAKQYPDIIDQMRRDAEPVFIRNIEISKKHAATWGLFYYCPEHSVQLEFDIDNPTEHRCPVDGKIFTGEPYDGSWWCRRYGRYSAACLTMANLYLLTGERAYADKAVMILCEFAKAYSGFEIHGNIPCNRSGRIFAQAITDSSFVRTMAIAYDSLESAMTQEQRDLIRDSFFIPAAEFLIGQRTNQLHNHEVIISSAIAIIGILFDRRKFIDFGVYSKYGLIYQLDNGVLDDGLWFEGSIGYHFLTLNSLFDYEKIARHSQYTTLSHPNYIKMLHVVLNLLQPDRCTPLINDMSPSSKAQGRLGSVAAFEFAYAHFHDPIILKELQVLYRERKREGADIFLYGVDELPPDPEPDMVPELRDYHNDGGSGLTVLRGPKDAYLLIRHCPYGGEHDHFDRLGLSFLSHGVRIAPDLGTTGYGAKMHYQYYKNTATHNTVCIDGGNQPPSGGHVNAFEKRPDGIYLDISTDWLKPYPLPDIFALTEWNEETYKGVSMRRRLIWTGRYYVDLFTVCGADPSRSIDWMNHFTGVRLDTLNNEEPRGAVYDTKPLKYMKNLTEIPQDDDTRIGSEEKQSYRIRYDCGGVIAYFYLFQNGNQVVFGQGPDNPGIKDMSLVMSRTRGGTGEFLSVVEACRAGEEMIRSVSAYREESGNLVVTINNTDGSVQKHRL